MEAAKNSLDRILTCAERTRDAIKVAPETAMSAEEEAMVKEAEAFRSKYEEAMEDDFNTADAISAIFELVKFMNTNITESSSKAFDEALYKELFELSDICGLILEKKEEILDEEIEKLIEERQAARKEKNFARADEIRALLLDKGIVLEDTREGVKWKRA